MIPFDSYTGILGVSVTQAKMESNFLMYNLRNITSVATNVRS